LAYVAFQYEVIGNHQSFNMLSYW